MSESLKSIVNTYVSLNNRDALERLRQHRQRLKTDLQMRPKDKFDTEALMSTLKSDLEIIEAGLAKL